VKETGHDHNKHSGQIRFLHVLAEDSMEQVLNFRPPTHGLPEEGNKALKHALAQRNMLIHIQACQTMMLRSEFVGSSFFTNKQKTQDLNLYLTETK
jgi:hypothetical protein